jgi:hypothetical protein
VIFTGIPYLRYTVSAIRHRVEVEQVRINSKYLAALYQIGLVRVFKFPDDSIRSPTTEEESLEMIIQMRVWGLPMSQQEFSLFSQEMGDIQLQTTTTTSASATVPEEETEDDTEQWIRELFRNDPWFDTEYLCSDMSFLLTDNFLIVTGYACNCFILWSLTTKSMVKKVVFPHGVLATHKVCICTLCAQLNHSSSTITISKALIDNDRNLRLLQLQRTSTCLSKDPEHNELWDPSSPL